MLIGPMIVKLMLIVRMLHNYSIKVNEELGHYKREKFNISIGDELPAGVLKLPKVYIAKKRKLKVGDKFGWTSR